MALLSVELSDGYQPPQTWQWIFTNKSCNQSAAKLKFSTSEQFFPQVLQADSSVLLIRLAIDSSAVNFKPRYSARFIDNGYMILNKDTSNLLQWSPQSSDTGYRKLIITVGDSVSGFDTIRPSFLVVPKNQYPCSFSATFSGQTTENGTLDLFSHPAPETLFFTIHDDDNILTEQYRVTVALHNLRSTQTLNQKEFFITIVPEISRSLDTLSVSVNDMTGKPDSMQFVIQYPLPTDTARPIKLQTSAEDFNRNLQVGKDSINVHMQIIAGTGKKPFLFNAWFLDNGKKILTNDTTGLLHWKPLTSDTGIRKMRILVKDSNNTTDSISPELTVMLKNQFPCSLSYSYSGTTSPSGILKMFSYTQPESILFVIHDADNPATEHYTVTVIQRHKMINLDLPGANRSFSVKIAPDTLVLKDTLIVTLKDVTGKPDTVRPIVQYPIHAFADVPSGLLLLNASHGVTTSHYSTQISNWADTTQYINLIQPTGVRQPTLVQNIVNNKPAVHFDHLGTNSDDGFYDASFTNWADAPFTVFVVFSATSLPLDSRQTLVSTNTTDGFGLGITCDGKIGIFNDIEANTCNQYSSMSSDLAVAMQTWYVASFQSTQGIVYQNGRRPGYYGTGNIQVNAWLNGSAASQTLDLATQADAGLMIGTGATDYNGSFGGYIAAVVIYQRSLTEDERVSIERLLGYQYGIAVK
jgi:hypothetical protein